MHWPNIESKLKELRNSKKRAISELDSLLDRFESELYITPKKPKNYAFTQNNIKHIKKKGKKYRLIYADPPWEYKCKKYEGACEYPTMKVKELAELDVSSICDTDCALIMWVTFPQLEVGLSLMKSWGFKYKTCFYVWGKVYKDGSPVSGLGHYTKSGAEICLLGTKGTVLKYRKSRSVKQLILAPIKGHSTKPLTAIEGIEEFFGKDFGPKIEFFSRNPRKDWDAWGNQIDLEQCSKSHLAG